MNEEKKNANSVQTYQISIPTMIIINDDKHRFAIDHLLDG